MIHPAKHAALTFSYAVDWCVYWSFRPKLDQSKDIKTTSSSLSKAQPWLPMFDTDYDCRIIENRSIVIRSPSGPWVPPRLSCSRFQAQDFAPRPPGNRYSAKSKVSFEMTSDYDMAWGSWKYYDQKNDCDQCLRVFNTKTHMNIPCLLYVSQSSIIRFGGIDCRVDHFEPWQYHTILASKAWYPDAKLNNGMPTQAPKLKSWPCEGSPKWATPSLIGLPVKSRQ